MYSQLLHAENLSGSRMPLVGPEMADNLGRRAFEVFRATLGVDDPPMSVVVRTKNNAQQLGGLLEDINSQCVMHRPEIIVVDTDSTDDTPRIARQMGATVLTISQADYSHPVALNMGFAAASNPYVFSLVGHSNLSNVRTLGVATRWAQEPNFAGAYGVALPNANATWTERAGAVLLGVPAVLAHPAERVDEPASKMGVMATNCCVIAREAWAEVGGFDPSFGAGGEDGQLARMVQATGGRIYLDPALSVYHTHGLGPINGLQQLLHWRQMGHPMPFDQKRLLRYRPDLRQK